MIVVFRKKRGLLLACMLVLMTGLAGAGYQTFFAKDAFLPSAGKTIVIDAGHGAQYKYYRK